MSAGEFINSKYLASYAANVHPIKIQPETADAVIGAVNNNATATALNNPISARSRKGKREFGLGARTVTLEWTSTAPAGYTGDPVTIPALTPAFYDAAVKGATGTYLGQAVAVVSRNPEDAK